MAGQDGSYKSVCACIFELSIDSSYFIWSVSVLFLKVYQTSKLGFICNVVYADTCWHISVQCILYVDESMLHGIHGDR